MKFTIWISVRKKVTFKPHLRYNFVVEHFKRATKRKTWRLESLVISFIVCHWSWHWILSFLLPRFRRFKPNLKLKFSVTVFGKIDHRHYKDYKATFFKCFFIMKLNFQQKKVKFFFRMQVIITIILYNSNR